MLRVYVYQKCSTCRNALQWLRNHNVPFEEIAIRETPPTEEEIRAMLTAKAGNWRALFNTSGQDYRALALKDKLPHLSEEESLALLRSNGMLVKRPFALNPTVGIYLLGFKEPEWRSALL